MAQPAPAPEIAPSQTIRIQNGVPDQDSVEIDVGQAVELHNQDNTPYQIPLSYLTGGSTDNYPLAVLLPAGGKFNLIGLAPATCEYLVSSVSAADRVEGGPPYTIIVKSGE